MLGTGYVDLPKTYFIYMKLHGNQSEKTYYFIDKHIIILVNL